MYLQLCVFELTGVLKIRDFQYPLSMNMLAMKWEPLFLSLIMLKCERHTKDDKQRDRKHAANVKTVLERTFGLVNLSL